MKILQTHSRRTKYLMHFLIRYLYYRLSLNKFYNPFRRKKKKHYKLTLNDIQTALESFGVKKGDSLLVHSSFSHIEEKPDKLILFLKEHIGDTGNILMPTHPRLEFDEKKQLLVYDVNQSKSTVGYLTEVFRKSRGTKRSFHPFSSIAVWGKDQKYFLNKNINKNKPLPHGIDSPYYRIAKKNGKAIFLGVTPRRATIMHTAEEILDSTFTIPDFFEEHEVLIKKPNNELEKVVVRKADLKTAQLYVSKSKVLNDWMSNGIMKILEFNGVSVSYVDCGKAVSLMLSRIKSGDSYYPFAPKKK